MIPSLSSRQTEPDAPFQNDGGQGRPTVLLAP